MAAADSMRRRYELLLARVAGFITEDEAEGLRALEAWHDAWIIENCVERERWRQWTQPN